MEIVGYLILAWFVGIVGADMAKPKFETRKSGEYIYQFKQDSGARKIVKYRAYGNSTCRPQCSMSGTFFDAAVRPLAPWPFRRGRFYECPKDGELDYCTGEIFENGKWVLKPRIIEIIEEEKP